MELWNGFESTKSFGSFSYATSEHYIHVFWRNWNNSTSRYGFINFLLHISCLTELYKAASSYVCQMERVIPVDCKDRGNFSNLKDVLVQFKDWSLIRRSFTVRGSLRIDLRVVKLPLYCFRLYGHRCQKLLVDRGWLSYEFEFINFVMTSWAIL